jgi:formylglycine-generating enzyme required for sulfatase activity
LFRSALSSLASAAENVYELTNFTQLNGRFDSIARDLTVVTTNTTFEMKTPSFGIGTKIRMTFDNVSAAASSSRYVEGTVAAGPNRTYMLTNITYKGTSADSGTQMSGVMNGTEVIYTFHNFKGYDFDVDKQVKQWTQRSGSAVWQVNSEYEAGNSTSTTTEYKSAVVYIVLDNSRSLSDSDVIAVRTATKQFVQTLYERSKAAPVVVVVQPSTPTPPPPPPVTPMPANFVRIAGGLFTMGSPASEVDRYSNEVQHQVTISTPFYISKYEVTQKEWIEVMGSNPSYFKGDNQPVEQVSWYDAVAYCNARSVKEGLTPAYTVSGTNVTWNRNANGYRLPTEAEWEYAAKGGSGAGYLIYAGSNSVDSVGWYWDNSGSKTHPVGTKAANGLGLYDMSGNVWEWCWDWFGSYSTSSQTDPLGASSGSYRVYRGGSWNNNGQYLRSAWRGDDYPPSKRGSGIGFRLVRPSLSCAVWADRDGR